MAATLRSRHVGKPSPSRPVVTGRRDCITGEVPSGKAGMGYRMVAYEGLLARDFILILEQDDAVLRYQEEPAPFRWHDGVRWRSYTADFAVEIDDGRRVAVEVKPRKRVIRLGWDGFRPRIEAGARAAGYDGFEPGPRSRSTRSASRTPRSSRASAPSWPTRRSSTPCASSSTASAAGVSSGNSGRRRGSRPAPSGPSWPWSRAARPSWPTPAGPSTTTP
ncbi:Tn7 transposase TnsA N-terminal domain-containing protein [Methylobacterium komagatae]|uniref:Tn7 transposase TnsA N-terminal domain-containing protein n=1 Tax=Methylobacterium komagatae TaxID=374425 RepID=A0ABW2BJ91_9HYPH